MSKAHTDRAQAAKDISGPVEGLSDTEKDELIKRLRALCTHDPLTGIGNRLAYDLTMRRVADREDRTIALLLLDLDHFKRLNDQDQSHQLGDKALRTFAIIVSRLLRDFDHFYRIGGEEFGIPFAIRNPTEGSLSDLVFRHADRIRIAVQDFDWQSVGLPSLTVSIGGAIAQTKVRPDELFQRADKALYAAKEGGRNRVAIFSDDTEERRHWTTRRLTPRPPHRS